jgi:hypothetical protein
MSKLCRKLNACPPPPFFSSTEADKEKSHKDDSELDFSALCPKVFLVNLFLCGLAIYLHKID